MSIETDVFEHKKIRLDLIPAAGLVFNLMNSPVTVDSLQQKHATFQQRLSDIFENLLIFFIWKISKAGEITERRIKTVEKIALAHITHNEFGIGEMLFFGILLGHFDKPW